MSSGTSDYWSLKRYLPSFCQQILPPLSRTLSCWFADRGTSNPPTWSPPCQSCHTKSHNGDNCIDKQSIRFNVLNIFLCMVSTSLVLLLHTFHRMASSGHPFCTLIWPLDSAFCPRQYLQTLQSFHSPLVSSYCADYMLKGMWAHQ